MATSRKQGGAIRMADKNTWKYEIKATIKVDGTIQRKDVVGAVFGQTEGLLGDELEMRQLQRTGRLGHVEVVLESQKGKVSGVINIPSSLDNVETAIIGSALETIDRIGPCGAIIKVQEIQDVRMSKRKVVVDRAKDLLLEMVNSGTEASRTVIEEVRAVLTLDDATSISGMTAGPNVATSDAIIIVEGRNDVLNLLGGGIKNAIAAEGSGVKPELIELAGKKNQVTVFVDGDRGGELLLRELAGAIDVDFVAQAPSGQEVEHLPMKTVTKCLNMKEPVAKVLARLDQQLAEDENRRERRGRRGRGDKADKAEAPSVPEPPEGLGDHFGDLKKNQARLVFADETTSDAIGASKLAGTVGEAEEVVAIIFNGAVSNRILEIAAEGNIDTVVGTTVAKDLGSVEGVTAYATGA